jgi:hypothetical protein
MWQISQTGSRWGKHNVGKEALMKSSVSLAAMLLFAGAVWAQEPQKPANPATNTTQTQASTPANQSNGAALAELKTQSYKGTLVDMACAGGGTAADSSHGCAVSSSTKEFALRTKDGQTLRFDSVGNDRVAEALRNKKKWNDLVSAGKSIEVTVNGVVSGDKLTVVSIS